MKRVAFQGFVADSLREFDAYVRQHKDAEIWGFNASELLEQGPMIGRNYDRWYELHAVPKLGEDLPRLAKARCTVVMQQPHPDVPRSVAYPIEAAKALLVYPYITNTITMMVAHAILDGFEEIALFGIDMAVRMGDGPSELSEQRPSVEYVLGIAVGCGIRIVIPGGSDLLKTNVIYGYGDHVDSVLTRVRRRRETLVEKLKYYRSYSDVYRGALEELDSFESRLLNSEAEPGEKR